MHPGHFQDWVVQKHWVKDSKNSWCPETSDKQQQHLPGQAQGGKLTSCRGAAAIHPEEFPREISPRGDEALQRVREEIGQRRVIQIQHCKFLMQNFLNKYNLNNSKINVFFLQERSIKMELNIYQKLHLSLYRVISNFFDSQLVAKFVPQRFMQDKLLFKTTLFYRTLLGNLHFKKFFY